MVSVEFENAYDAYIGIMEKEFTEAGVPEEYAAEGLHRNMMPPTIVKLWNEGVTLDFVEAFLKGRELHRMWTSADAAIINIISLYRLLRSQEVPEDYSHALLRMGAGYTLISDSWHNGIALEYAQQMAAERVAERSTR